VSHPEYSVRSETEKSSYLMMKTQLAAAHAELAEKNKTIAALSREIQIWRRHAELFEGLLARR
jgi:hypothetical protein